MDVCSGLQELMRMRRIGLRRALLCPFVTQDELIVRFHADLGALRADPAAFFQTRTGRDAFEHWLRQAVARLGATKIRAAELEIIVAEWRHQRAAFRLSARRADIIIVDDSARG